MTKESAMLCDSCRRTDVKYLVTVTVFHGKHSERPGLTHDEYWCPMCVVDQAKNEDKGE